MFSLHPSSYTFSILNYNTTVRSRVLWLTKELLSLACLDKTSAKHEDYTQQHKYRIHIRQPQPCCCMVHLYKHGETMNYRSLCLSIMSPSCTNAEVKTTQNKRQELSISSRLQAHTVYFTHLLYRKIKSLKRDTFLYLLYDKDLFAYTFLKARLLYPVVILQSMFSISLRKHPRPLLECAPLNCSLNIYTYIHRLFSNHL